MTGFYSRKKSKGETIMKEYKQPYDIAYEDWHGHRLDRQLLELLRSY